MPDQSIVDDVMKVCGSRLHDPSTGRCAKFTVLGANGFIGRHLVAALKRAGHPCQTPDRQANLGTLTDPGHIIYAIGLTADFRNRPLDTIQAHVCQLLTLLQKPTFQSLLYLSSTRVYAGAEATHPDTSIPVNPTDPSDLYNLSKLTGESMCLAMANGTSPVRVVRLANVVGIKTKTDDFLISLIHDALTQGHIHLRTALHSAKDYVDVNDVVHLLMKIALKGRQRIYNLASGENVSHAAIVGELARITGCTVTVASSAPHWVFPVIDIQSMREEFGFQPARLIDLLEPLVHAYQKAVAQEKSEK